MDAVDVEKVGTPEEAGATREGKSVELIVLADTSTGPDDLAEMPNYHVDPMGTIRMLVAEERAGDVLGLAIYNKRRYNIDRIGISIMLQCYEAGDYSDEQRTALSGLLDDISARHKLDENAMVRILPDTKGRPRVTPSLPPAPSAVSGDMLGAAPMSREQEMWLFLYGESYKPRGGALKIAQALPLHAAKFKLGTPLGPNDATTTVATEGHTYSVQPFATDLIFYEGTQYAAVQSMNALFDDDAAEIPAKGTSRALLEAYYRISIATTEKRTGALKGTKVLRPDWRFHLVAKNGRLGPAMSDNYVFKADQDYAFQIFGADVLYTPMSDQTGCERLNLTDPAHPAFNALWGEVYRFMGVPFDANSPYHKKAVELRIGVPLTNIYSTDFGGATYAVQVWTLDTIYAGTDGQIRRMSDLPMTAEAQAWTPAAPKPIPPTPPNPLPPVVPPSNAGAPRPNDINWPPRPDFSFLTDKNGAREKALGKIEWVRTNGDNIRITNSFASNIIKIHVPQLAKIKGGGDGHIMFHKVAAEQMKRLWAAWEAAGLLSKVLMFAGTFVPRTIRNNPRVLSNHAYGTAFDINVAWNGLMKVAALVGQQGSVRELVPLANAHGFYWGGHWNYDGKGASDGMHFEWAVPR
ncbi:M15 family metallopeptidase [Candidatus Oscillochloris fontis]|uniref:M15 family metallopeptidase n=1 Tax=Candidatus Oscillochloris fontis TaxID=2496868 RepID=UPI00101DFCE3|nr:M15 family metallopeptidase [Candidatus Oscillochloris fontis]